MAGGSYEHQRNLDGDLLISYSLWYTRFCLFINGNREGNCRKKSESLPIPIKLLTCRYFVNLYAGLADVIEYVVFFMG